jgi:hypothetical protein
MWLWGVPTTRINFLVGNQKSTTCSFFANICESMKSGCVVESFATTCMFDYSHWGLRKDFPNLHLNPCLQWTHVLSVMLPLLECRLCVFIYNVDIKIWMQCTFIEHNVMANNEFLNGCIKQMLIFRIMTITYKIHLRLFNSSLLFVWSSLWA